VDVLDRHYVHRFYRQTLDGRCVVRTSALSAGVFGFTLADGLGAPLPARMNGAGDLPMRHHLSILAITAAFAVVGCKKDAAPAAKPAPATPAPAAAPAPAPAPAAAEPAAAEPAAAEPAAAEPAAAEPAAAEPAAADPAAAPAAAQPAEAPAAAEPAVAPAAAEPAAGPNALCEKAFDHVVGLIQADPTLPAEAKAAMKAEATDPAKRAANIEKCTKDKPELVECMLKATDMAGVGACQVPAGEAAPAAPEGGAAAPAAAPEGGAAPAPEGGAAPTPPAAPGDPAIPLKGSRIKFSEDG
jgi:hypothetical protein